MTEKACDYLVLTQIIIDDVYFPHRQPILNQLGGGTYTAAGMRYWSDRVGICSGLGEDFHEHYDSWFERNGISVYRAPREEKCTHAKINYFPDGEREELLLPGCGSHARMQAGFDEIPGDLHGVKGLYLFKDCDCRYWQEAAGYLRANPAQVVWEISPQAADPQYKELYESIMKQVDFLSLNLTEGRRLTGEQAPLDVVKSLADFHVFRGILRMGAHGALAFDKQACWHVAAAPAAVVDVTGGGNSCTGGQLVGYCQSGGDLVHAAKCGSVSASFIIRQYGVPPVIDSREMKKAQEMLQTIRTERL